MDVPPVVSVAIAFTPLWLMILNVVRAWFE